MRRHPGGLRFHTDGKPFTDFLADRHVMEAADLDVAMLCGMRHEVSNTSARETDETGRHYRRVVTRRASSIFPPEPAFRKQDAAKFGQTWLEQFEAAARTSSRSPLASTATSSVCTLGAKPGKAITEAPRTKTIARADSDLTILSC